MSAGRDSYDAESGMLSARGLAEAIDAELARAARHELGLSLVYIDVSPTPGGNGAEDRRVPPRVAEALAACVRAEDRVARLAPHRFAVLGVQGAEATALGARIGGLLRRHLRGLDPKLVVTVAAVDCQYDEMSRQELQQEAESALAAAIERTREVQLPTATFRRAS